MAGDMGGVHPGPPVTCDVWVVCTVHPELLSEGDIECCQGVPGPQGHPTSSRPSRAPSPILSPLSPKLPRPLCLLFLTVPREAGSPAAGPALPVGVCQRSLAPSPPLTSLLGLPHPQPRASVWPCQPLPWGVWVPKQCFMQPLLSGQEPLGTRTLLHLLTPAGPRRPTHRELAHLPSVHQLAVPLRRDGIGQFLGENELLQWTRRHLQPECTIAPQGPGGSAGAHSRSPRALGASASVHTQLAARATEQGSAPRCRCGGPAWPEDWGTGLRPACGARALCGAQDQGTLAL